MTDEKDAWNAFYQSGSVLDYLQYRSVRNARHGGEPEEDRDEIQDQGTGTQNTGHQ